MLPGDILRVLVQRLEPPWRSVFRQVSRAARDAVDTIHPCRTARPPISAEVVCSSVDLLQWFVEGGMMPLTLSARRFVESRLASATSTSSSGPGRTDSLGAGPRAKLLLGEVIWSFSSGFEPRAARGDPAHAGQQPAEATVLSWHGPGPPDALGTNPPARLPRREGT